MSMLSKRRCTEPSPLGGEGATGLLPLELPAHACMPKASVGAEVHGARGAWRDRPGSLCGRKTGGDQQCGLTVEGALVASLEIGRSGGGRRADGSLSGCEAEVLGVNVVSRLREALTVSGASMATGLTRGDDVSSGSGSRDSLGGHAEMAGVGAQHAGAPTTLFRCFEAWMFRCDALSMGVSGVLRGGGRGMRDARSLYSTRCGIAMSCACGGAVECVCRRRHS